MGPVSSSRAAATIPAPPFPLTIDDLFPPGFSPTAPRVHASPPSPRRSLPLHGGDPRHYVIEPGRWRAWIDPRRSPEQSILGAPPASGGDVAPSNLATVAQASLELGRSSPDASSAMADQDGHTCPWSSSAPYDPNGGRRQVGSGNPNSPPTSSCDAASWAEIGSIFDHFWNQSRVPPSPSPTSTDSFGWWRGKVAGDPRSFAQVAASSLPEMGDGGGRFGPRRGGRAPPSSNRGRGRNVWQRDEVAQSSSNQLRGSGSQNSGDRWEAAARGAEQRRQEVISPAPGGNPIAAQGAGANPQMATGDPPCLNCNIKGHYTARCPTIRCERCKRLGHISQICQVILPWECIPSMCGFQAPGRGFFFMPDHSSAKQTKERASSVVITIIEGEASSRQIEKEFNLAFGDSWRCTARTIGPNQYIMRFPTQVEVERAVYYGSSMKLKTVDATVRLTAWTASVGAKAVLQKAWVRISNIPLDKRVEENAFYVGSLVGVSLDLDISTLHKPEYVRVLVGCRDVERIPASAEGCLGDNFYDFFYEIDKVVVGGPPKDNAGATVSTNANVPSPKRPRMERSVTVTEESSENQVMGSQSESGRRQRACDTITEVNDESLAMDNDSEDDSAGGNELLIETMAKEHEARQLAGSPPNSWLVPCSLIHKEQLPDPRGTEAVASLLPPLSQNLSANIWPPLPSITDISDGSNSPLVGSPDYVVQSPEGSHEDNLVVPEADETRFSSRIFPSANEDVMRKAMQATKKRNLEGLQKEVDKGQLAEGAKKLMHSATIVFSAPSAASGNRQMLLINAP
ncbi:hypothetical protein QYE76_006242 [Lolium multiflorum]|uniref:CCHC-type domain-containing protein n=1 Tax=Lolium multiflorum TaxID=4521 RepID=A0AAD8RVZ4_LOLMU|nr:hypothetical protein QYE76_006242 [Lolium multiflorum]